MLQWISAGLDVCSTVYGEVVLMAVIRTILGIFIMLVSIGLVVVVLLQKSKGEGLGSIGGGGQLFFNAESRFDAFLSKVTTYLAVAFLALALLASAIGVFN